MLAYSARNRSASIRIPWVSSPKGRRIEVRFPDPMANPYLAFSAMMLAASTASRTRSIPRRDGQGPVRPGARGGESIPTVCHALDMALDYLDKDRAFLTAGGVFTDDLIDAYIALKMDEVTRMRMTTHPIEYDMYYSL